MQEIFSWRKAKKRMGEGGEYGRMEGRGVGEGMTDGYMGGYVDGWMGGRMDENVDGWTEGKKEGRGKWRDDGERKKGSETYTDSKKKDFVSAKIKHQSNERKNE